MPNRFGALIFDMDGVIVDSNPAHREAWRQYNLRHGIETDEAMQQRMYGRRNDEIVRDFYGDHLDDAEIQRHGAAKEQLYRELIGPGVAEALVPGMREFLDRHARIPAALATNAEPANVHFVLRAANLERAFRVIVDGHQVRNPKPHPDIYLRAAELLGLEPAACLVFEDSASGIQAALAAGMKVVGLLTTHTDLGGVELAVDNFNSPELERWLEEGDLK